MVRRQNFPILKSQNMVRQLTITGHAVAPALQPVMIDKLWVILDSPDQPKYLFPQKSLAALIA